MVLLDANVVLDLLEPEGRNAKLTLEWFDAHPDEYGITMLTVHLVLHFGLNAYKFTYAELESFLAGFLLIDLTTQDYYVAMKLVGSSDHEDALQLAVALRMGCSAIVTRDKAFARLYKKDIDFVIPQ